MATVFRKIGGLVLLVAAAPFALLYVRADYGPVALFFCGITVAIASAAIFFIVTPSRRSRY